jgi:hypothetical protein
VHVSGFECRCLSALRLPREREASQGRERIPVRERETEDARSAARGEREWEGSWGVKEVGAQK